MSSPSTTKTNFFFGWDLLFRTLEKTVNKKSDLLIALTHFLLIRHAKFRCIGLGEDKTFSEEEQGSELLPYGWNDSDTKYALRYVFNKQLFLLMGHKTGKSVIINLLDAKTQKVSNIALDPDELVQRMKGSLTEMIPRASEIANRLIKELVEPVFTGSTREITTQTVNPNPSTPRRSVVDPLRIGDPLLPRAQFGSEPLHPFGWQDVGRGDLDPLGRAPPGNLVPLPSAPDFQHDGRPRFDPYGVPETNTPPNPNPDHLRPPRFNGSDFYM